ncbi:MAG: type II secretion system protein [Candidatus Omnitrophica bacterium]|nr:type II secretion system protein [Candidatus Omnitrophota bacterium]
MKKNQALRKPRGFALIEMVIAFVVLGILSLAVLPKTLESLKAVRTGAAADKLMSDIRYARWLALSHHTYYGIEIKQANNAYDVFSYNASSNTKTLITDPHTNKAMTVDFDLLPEFSGVQIVAVDFCAAGSCVSQSVIFDAFGVPMDNNEATYTSDATVSLNTWSSSSSDSTARTVTVHAATAFTEVS